MINIYENYDNEIANKIIDKCIILEKLANKIYNKFGHFLEDNNLSQLFYKIAIEESRHVGHWLVAKKIINDKNITNIFENPKRAINELSQYENEFIKIYEISQESLNEGDIIEYTVQIERYFINPIFIKLINLIDHYECELGVKKSYDNHINDFIQILKNNKKFDKYVMRIKDLQIIWDYASKLGELNFRKNEIIGIVCHDLLNPLTSVKGLSQLLELKFKMKNSNQQQIIREILGQCDYMINLIKETLDISSIESGIIKLNYTLVNIHKLIHKSINIMNITAKENNIIINYVSSNENKELSIDHLKLEQSIINLISNAIKYSPENSEIIIRAEWFDNHINISIQDFGVGIPEKEQDKLFKPYSKTSVKPFRNQKSTGLGLSISQRLIRFMGGEITFVSQEKKGSTFNISLPIRKV